MIVVLSSFLLVADAFSTLCVVQADLSLLNGSAEPKAGKNGKKYWTIVFSVEIHFGLTEFKARIKWMDNVSFRLCCVYYLGTALITFFFFFLLLRHQGQVR